MTCCQGEGPQTARASDLVGRDEREQLGHRPQVVVDQAGVDGLGDVAAVGLPGQPVGRVGVPAAERGGLLGGCGGVAEDVARGRRRRLVSQSVEAAQALAAVPG